MSILSTVRNWFRRPSKPDELVLCITTAKFKEVGFFTGLNFEVEPYLQCIEENGFLTSRAKAETNPEFKQIIPYVMIYRNSGEWFTYERNSSGSEQRLHNKVSLGVGGHMNSKKVAEEVTREINEEVSLTSTIVQEQLIPAAVLNADVTEVDKVHLGLVIATRIPSYDNVVSNETHLRNPRFLKPDQIREIEDRLESWSLICFQSELEIFERTFSTKPHVYQQPISRPISILGAQPDQQGT